MKQAPPDLTVEQLLERARYLRAIAATAWAAESQDEFNRLADRVARLGDATFLVGDRDG
jgi:hypothetical protein